MNRLKSTLIRMEGLASGVAFASNASAISTPERYILDGLAAIIAAGTFLYVYKNRNMLRKQEAD